MGVVYHANYLVWFEIGRVERMRAMGFDYGTLEREEGCLIAVVEATARYKLPARYDDELVIRTRVSGARSSLIKFSYIIVRPADEGVLCTGETTHVVVGRDMRKRSLPERYLAAFGEAVRQDAGAGKVLVG